MTVMVRDEADIIQPMIEHALAQGVDTLIVTDNGSVDGTAEILEGFGDAIDLRHDPVHRKQQHAVVTAMARDAATRYGADWVINADADEFWLPRQPGATVKDLFDEMPRSLNSFAVPVFDMTGAPSERGTGLQRLRYRDLRPLSRMNELGIHAHATPDAVHIASPDITIAQGNHSVSLAQEGSVPSHLELEVLHFPWRSWEQFETKVRNAGRAYEANPELAPSPNHHGMREYLRYRRGALFPFYVIRHPDEDELSGGLTDGSLQEDDRIARVHTSPVADTPIESRRLEFAREAGPVIARVEAEERARADQAAADYASAVAAVEQGRVTIESLLADNGELSRKVTDLTAEMERIRARKVVRASDWISKRAH